MGSEMHHIVIFPLMAQGHTIPLLDLSTTFSQRGLRVTIVTTPLNAPSILQSISPHTNILLAELHFPSDDCLLEGCENTHRLSSMDPFLTFHLRRPFEQLLRGMKERGDAPIAVISDFFLGWTLDVCKSFDVPRLVFHGMGVFAIYVCNYLLVHAAQNHLKLEWEERLSVPRVSSQLGMLDVPGVFRDFRPEEPITKLIMDNTESEINSWGTVINSCVELEGHFLPHLESNFYRNGAKGWCVGPLNLNQEIEMGSNMCIKWLNQQSRTVLYISFGSQAHLADEQLDEIGFALEAAGHPFIWVIRSTTWAPPEGMEERLKGKGLVVRGWAEQRQILSHPRVGGFLSHCGWNSVVESLSAGVPILAWPMIAEGGLNAVLLAEELKLAVRIEVGEEKIVMREKICEGVREVMGGEKGRMAGERAKEVGGKMRGAVMEGGSSHKCLTQLIDQLVANAK